MNQSTSPQNGQQAFERKAGTALIIFAILLLLTMVLHPAGNNIPGLIRMSTIILIVHSVAILSLPVGWTGFLGLTRRLGTDHFGAVCAFAFMTIGLIAAMMAATFNGLILPLYLQRYAGESDAVFNSLQTVLRYGFTINKAFDYLYTAAFCIAILTWSIAIVQTGKMDRRIGWTGIALSIIMLAIFFGGMADANRLNGLRIFLGGIIIWIILTGITLRRKTV
jgi:hypothetical protein